MLKIENLRPRLPRYPDNARNVWHCLCDHAGLPPATARQVWQAICSCRDSLAFRHSLTQMIVAGEPGSTDRHKAAEHFSGSRPASIHELTELLELCVSRKSLSRQDASMVETKLLAIVDKNGRWK